MIRTTTFAKFDKSWNFLEEYTEYQVQVSFNSADNDLYENNECYVIRIYKQEESDLQNYDPVTSIAISSEPTYDSNNGYAIKSLTIVSRE